jgi:hypothetical protein
MLVSSNRKSTNIDGMIFIILKLSNCFDYRLTMCERIVLDQLIFSKWGYGLKSVSDDERCI